MSKCDAREHAACGILGCTHTHTHAQTHTHTHAHTHTHIHTPTKVCYRLASLRACGAALPQDLMVVLRSERWRGIAGQIRVPCVPDAVVYQTS